MIELNSKLHITKLSISLAIFIAALYFYGDIVLFNLVYFALFLFASFRTLQSANRKRIRLLLIVTYFIVMVLQMAFYIQVVASHEFWLENPFRKLCAIMSLLLPTIIIRYVSLGKYPALRLPTFQEAVTISFSQVHELADSLAQTATTIKKTGGSLSPSNFKEIIDDLPRHDSFRYVNAGTLTDDYFRAAEASLTDPNLYIIISNTGTPANEIISVFTQKQFNHASVSFDAQLQTIVSYNNGERVYPPGLNREMLDYFNKKPDASILVYRLPVTREQKQAAIDKIFQINQEGSAFNLLGLFTSQSYKPNIMYCSQFVYSLLKHIGAAYFEEAGKIRPTDLIEKDYLRKLEFVEELRLNSIAG